MYSNNNMHRMARGESATEKAGTRVLFLDFLKTICLFGVILGHLCTWQIAEIAPGTIPWDISNLYNTICRVCVPVFLMISGYLALEEEHCRRKLPHSLRLAGHFGLTYLVWSAAYALPDWQSLLSAPQTLLPTLARGQFHLWYLLMLAGIYLLLPLLYRISRQPRELDYALAIMFGSTILLPSLAGVPGLDWLSSLQEKLYLDTGFLFYFLAGYWLRCRPLHSTARHMVYAAGVAATVWGYLATRMLSCQTGTFADFWLDQRSLTVALGAGALFVFCQHHITHLPPSVSRVCAALSRNSLGIYTTHVFFLLLLRKFTISVYRFYPVWWLPFLAVCILLCSWAITFVLRRLPVIQHFV